jgi:hypothetical protein
MMELLEIRNQALWMQQKFAHRQTDATAAETADLCELLVRLVDVVQGLIQEETEG